MDVTGVSISVRGGITVQPASFMRANGQNSGVAAAAGGDAADGSVASIDINGGSHTLTSQQAIQAALRRRSEAALLQRLHSMSMDDIRSASRFGADGAGAWLGDGVLNEQPPESAGAGAGTGGEDRSLCDDDSSAAYCSSVQCRVRLTLAVQLMDCLKREALLLLSDHCDVLAANTVPTHIEYSGLDSCDGFSGGGCGIPSSGAVMEVDPAALHAAFAFLQALSKGAFYLGTGDGAGEGSRTNDVSGSSSCGAVLFRNILSTFIGRFGVRCRVAVENGLSAPGVHDLLTNRCVPVLAIVHELRGLEQAHRQVLTELLAPAAKEGSSSSGLHGGLAALDYADKLSSAAKDGGYRYACMLA